MKAERLLAILTILLNRKKISAAQLSRELEVSIRTIYRDIEALAEAGIPVYATNGRNGGFELMEGFTMDTQILETGEIRQILTGLQGLSAIYPATDIARLTEKFNLLLKESGPKGIRCPESHIFIELTPSHREKQILELIEGSISRKTVLSIQYGDSYGTETTRKIEPLALVFMWQSWYVYTFCQLRKDFRLFKVSRIFAAEEFQDSRISPQVDLGTHPWNTDWESKPFERILITADRIARSRLGEFFDVENIEDIGDGRLQITARLPIDEWVISFLMGLPGTVKILEPESLREAIYERAKQISVQNGLMNQGVSDSVPI